MSFKHDERLTQDLYIVYEICLNGDRYMYSKNYGVDYIFTTKQLRIAENAALVVVEDKIVFVIGDFRDFPAVLVKYGCGILADIVDIVGIFNSGKANGLADHIPFPAKHES